MFDKEILQEQIKIQQLQEKMLDEGLGSMLGGAVKTIRNAAPSIANTAAHAGVGAGMLGGAAALGGGAMAAGAAAGKYIRNKISPPPQTTMQKVGGFVKDKATQLGNLAKPYINKAVTAAKPVVGAARTALGV